MNSRCSARFLLFIWPGTPPHGIVQPTFRVTLPPQLPVPESFSEASAEAELWKCWILSSGQSIGPVRATEHCSPPSLHALLPVPSIPDQLREVESLASGHTADLLGSQTLNSVYTSLTSHSAAPCPPDRCRDLALDYSGPWVFSPPSESFSSG